MKQRDAILKKIRDVPSLPASGVEVMRLLEQSDLNLNKVVRVVEHDPGLTGNLLRAANSVFFGTENGVKSVREAAMRLGTAWISKMVSASVVSPLVSKQVSGYDMPPGCLLTHSVAVAIGTEEVAAAMNLDAPPCAFTAGLLHDLGKIVLGTYVQVDAEPIKKLAFEKRVSFEDAEREVLGIDHAEAGAALLEYWKLPAAICQAVRWHHQPQNCPGDALVAELIHVSDDLGMLCGLGTGSDGTNYRPSTQALAHLHMRAAVAEQAVCRIMVKLDEWRALLAGPGGK